MTERLTNIIAMALFGTIIIVTNILTRPYWQIILLGALLVIAALLLFIFGDNKAFFKKQTKKTIKKK